MAKQRPLRSDDDRPTPLFSEAGGAGDQGPADFDRLIHERIRLGIVSALAVNDSLTFGDLKGMLGTTDGNLSTHLTRLIEADYLTADRSTGITRYRITAQGQAAFAAYVARLESLLHPDSVRLDSP